LAAKITDQAVPESELLLLASATRNIRAMLPATKRPSLTCSPPIQARHSGHPRLTLVSAPGFPDRLTLDVYHLRRATGALTAFGQYEDFTERASQAGRPDEAGAVLADGFTAQILTQATDSLALEEFPTEIVIRRRFKL